MPAVRGLLSLANVPDGQRRDGPPEPVVRREYSVIPAPVLSRRRDEISEPVEERKRREFDDAVGPRERGLSGTDPVNTSGSQRGGRPIVQYLPRHINAVETVEGAEWKPVVTDDFVLVPLPNEDQAEPIRIVFRERAAGG